MAGPRLGRCGGLPRHGPDITTHPQAPIAGLGWQHRQKHQHARAGRVPLPTETCKQSRSCGVLFPQGFSERNRPGCQEVVFLFFSFSWKFESTTLSPITRHFRERKQRSPKGKSGTLAGRAGPRVWKTSLHQEHNLFPGLGASAGLTHSFALSLQLISGQAVAHLGLQARRRQARQGLDLRDWIWPRDQVSHELAEAGPLWLMFRGSQKSSRLQAAQVWSKREARLVPRCVMLSGAPASEENSPGLAPEPRKEAVACGSQERGFWGPCN